MPITDLEKRKEYMKQYHLKYDKIYHQKNKQKILLQKKEWLKRYKEWFYDIKKQYSCIICGENHVACIDFHHRDPTKKLINIGNAFQHRYPKKIILEEIEKCDPLCSNCHRKLHYNE